MRVLDLAWQEAEAVAPAWDAVEEAEDAVEVEFDEEPTSPEEPSSEPSLEPSSDDPSSVEVLLPDEDEEEVEGGASVLAVASEVSEGLASSWT